MKIKLKYLILSILIILTTTYIYQQNQNKYKITLSAKNANGIKIDDTYLEYKGLKIGKVTNIQIDKDLNSTLITLNIKKEAMPLVTKKGNIFWLEKPKVIIDNISFNNFLSEYVIKLKPNLKTNKKTYHFKLSDIPPLKGYLFNLNTDMKLNIKTPILYKEKQIGEIIKKNNTFSYKAIIYPNFKKLINNSSIFIKTPILKMDPKGLNLKIDSLSEVLLGGINIITPKDTNLSKKEFKLYKNRDEALKKTYINLVFPNNSNIKQNTPIIYNQIKIGAIKKIFLKNTQLIAKAYIYDDYKYLLSDNSEFILQKPKISLTEIKNIKNIIFGDYIYLIPKKGKLTKNNFKVYRYNLNSENTIVLNLYTDSLNSISKNSKIYYKNIPIGQVLDYYFTSNFKQIKIVIGIKKEYKPLINNNSMFYDISSKLIALKNLKLNVNFDGVDPLINGGIALVTTPYKKLNKKDFKLYHSYQDIEELKKLKYKGFIKTAYFSNDFKLSKNMNIEFKNQTVGFIKDIHYKNINNSIATLFIYNKYKNLLSKHSIFYKKPALNIKANLNGINIKIDNLTSLIKGSIVLKNTNYFYKKLQILKSLKEIQKQNSITITFNSIEAINLGASIEYKKVKVGEVIDVKLKDNKTIIKALVNDEFKTKNSIYYLKKPIISLDEVKNITSLISLNIGVIKKDGNYTNKFIGYSTKPLNIEGKIFKLYTDKATQSINSPIYYKNVQIGKIININLSKDATKVILSALIKNKYLKLIRKNSKFYDISGIDMKFSLFGGTHIKTNTFTSIVKGGILVITPTKYSQKADSNNSFELFENLPENWQKISPKIP